MDELFLFTRLTKWMVIALFAYTMFMSQVYAVELWSNDLWLEQPTVPNEQGTTSPIPTPADSDPTTPTPPTQPTGTGLWSENLWTEPSAPINGSNTEHKKEQSQQQEQQAGQHDPSGHGSSDQSQLPLPQPQMPSSPDKPPGGGQGTDSYQPNDKEKLNPLTNGADTEQQALDAIQEVPLLVMQIGNPKAIVRGNEFQLSVPPAIVNGRTMVPLRLIGESLHAHIEWIADEKKILIETDHKRIEVWIGSERARVNDQEVLLEAPPLTFNGVTLVPIRFISEHFGYEIRFDQGTITIYEAGQSGHHKPVTIPETDGHAGAEDRTDVGTNTDPEDEPMRPEPTDATSPIEGSYSKYVGVWQLRMDGFSKGLEVGTLIIFSDGTYKMSHGVNGDAEGTWRGGGFDDVIGNIDMIILENGPGGMDWAMIPKQDGIMSVRYHYGYTGNTKIWFEDSLGIWISD